jgi:hypothetical protein
MPRVGYARHVVMRMTDRITSHHTYTQTDSGLVQNGNAERPRARNAMSGNDDAIMKPVRTLRGWRGFPRHASLTR